MTRPFRFGVVAPIQTELPAWRDRVRRIADSGYSTLLMPDVPGWQPAPGPTLALAAELADRGWGDRALSVEVGIEVGETAQLLVIQRQHHRAHGGDWHA